MRQKISEEVEEHSRNNLFIQCPPFLHSSCMEGKSKCVKVIAIIISFGWSQKQRQLHTFIFLIATEQQYDPPFFGCRRKSSIMIDS